ncbi:MAG: chorion class high-cysteine HCB protein 13 [Firmicutes bacterium]|nr:chorion class high-cysteine HCB protein 13 [Bacillota bacterium]
MGFFGCNNNNCEEGNNILWIIILLFLFCGCGNNVGGANTDDCSWIIILILLLCCCGCGNSIGGNGCGMCEA